MISSNDEIGQLKRENAELRKALEEALETIKELRLNWLRTVAIRTGRPAATKAKSDQARACVRRATRKLVVSLDTKGERWNSALNQIGSSTIDRKDVPIARRHWMPAISCRGCNVVK